MNGQAVHVDVQIPDGCDHYCDATVVDGAVVLPGNPVSDPVIATGPYAYTATSVDADKNRSSKPGRSRMDAGTLRDLCWIRSTTRLRARRRSVLPAVTILAADPLNPRSPVGLSPCI